MTTTPRHRNHAGTVRAIGMVRTSNDDSEHSPEVQARAIIRHATERGYELDPRDILNENVDGNGKVRKVSGGWDLTHRPKLARAIEMIEGRTHHVLIGERTDRWFRDLDLQREVIGRIERVGGRLESVKQGAVSHATAEAELHANLDGVIAQYQKRTAKERAWDAVEDAIAEGKSPGPVPPGLLRGPDGTLVPGKRREVKIVQKAFDMRDGGATVREVRDYLAARGIERTISGVRHMLSSKLYVGEVHFGNHTPNRHAHDAIIDRDVFDRVQKMVVPAGRRGKSDRLLARLGLLHCGSCGGRMSASGTGNGYMIYRCTSQRCERPVTISAPAIEAAVVQAVKDAARNRKGRARAAQRARQAAEHADRMQAAYAKAQRILADADDEAEAQRILAEKRQTRDDARERAERLAAVVGPEVTVDVAQVLDHGTLAEKRGVVRTRIERVTVEPGRDPGRVTIELVGE
jgi:DNA invertase Pin-like site-specific DNA recombinase